MSLTDDQLIEMIRQRVASFVSMYDIRPTYVSVASGLGGAGVFTVDGLPVIRVGTYGWGNAMGIEVGIAQHHDVARWGWIQPTPPTTPSGLSGVALESTWVWLCSDRPS